jgi:hypothetical protein
MAARSQPMLRIFVGCTSVDLKAYRHAARCLIEKFDEHALTSSKFHLERCSVTDKDALAELFSRNPVTHVVHLAS